MTTPPRTVGWVRPVTVNTLTERLEPFERFGCSYSLFRNMSVRNAGTLNLLLFLVPGLCRQEQETLVSGVP